MKDLKDYFNASSSKSDNSETPMKSNENVQNSSANHSSKNRNENSKNSKKNGRKKKFSGVENEKHDRKTLSQSPVENCDVLNEFEENEENSENPEILSPKTPAVNAFQFLMSSRNKIIGTNSPGKELTDKEKSPPEVNKQTLKARKQLLQDWSDTKKASKRKLEDEEIDKCIKVKLDVRKKRFKTLLNVESTDDENSRDASCGKFKENRNSSDDFECKTQDDVQRSKKKKHKHKKKEHVNATPSKSWKLRIKLVDEGDIEQENCSKKEIADEVIENDVALSKSKKLDENVIIIDESPKVNHSDGNGRVLRNRTSLQKPKMYADYSDEDEDEREKQKKLKVAPVFSKSIPRPKEDPAVVEARRKFLLSEIPDVLKKKIEKLECITVPDFDVFPKVAHVKQENQDEFWKLPEITLKMAGNLGYILSVENCENLIDRRDIEKFEYETFKPLKNIKSIIRNLKLENPAFPVYRTYRLLKEKQLGDEENSMWTEKYKAECSADLLGNSQAISTLKNWLESWNEMLSISRKRSKVSSDSESDFQSDDEGCGSLKRGVILIGPSGSGKSSTVYGLCNELGFNVIELNASSRRTGKQVLQELQEATQSHQVRKNKVKKSKKMCVLLIEDIDIIFEQDDAFIFAISQISSTTKRPIILTTTDKTSPHTQKFINDFKTINFRRISTPNFTIWSQILCLLEGVFVDNCTIFELFERNNGDVRKTLLELQLWVESGGQINKNKNLLSAIFHVKPHDVAEIEDDDVSLKEFTGKLENYRIHQNVVMDFENFSHNLPLWVDLRNVWWNFPRYLGEFKKTRKNRDKLKIVSRTFDSFAICDVVYRKIGYKCDVPICGKRWDYKLQDSLKIDEINAEFSSNYEFFMEWNHFLLDKSLEGCKRRFENPRNQRLINMGAPDFVQQTELMKNHRFEEELMEAVPLSSHLDRKSVSLDYLSTLRNIARLEKKRKNVGNSSKRNNRFYNYLQNFNVDCSNTAMLEFASNTLRNDS